MGTDQTDRDPLDTQELKPAPQRPDTTTTPSESHDETGIHGKFGVPPDAVVLARTDSPPMRSPENAWGMLVVAVDIFSDTDPYHAGKVALFAAQWLSQQPTALLHDGDVVIRLVNPEEPNLTRSNDSIVDIDLLAAHRGQWQLVDRWHNADNRWPQIVAPVAASIMDLYADGSAAATPIATTTRKQGSLQPSPARFGLRALISSGLLRAGEQLVLDRPNLGECYTARINVEGRLVFPDGRTFGTPGGAMAALGKVHHNGWILWRRESDGRLLSELRAECLANGQATTTNPTS